MIYLVKYKRCIDIEHKRLAINLFGTMIIPMLIS